MNTFVWTYPAPQAYAELANYTEFQMSKDGLFEHQKIVARLLSDLTEYRDLLLFHGVGSGKTCSAIKTAELLRDVGAVKQCVVLTKGRPLQRQIMNEIVYTCAPESYPGVPPRDDTDEGSEAARRNKVSAALRPFYRFYTFGDFAKIIARLADDDAQVVKVFSNTCFIVDEVQNIREQNVTGTFDALRRVAALAQNRYMILLSATPMRDTWKEIVYTGALFGTEVPPGIETATSLTPKWMDQIRKQWEGRVSTVLSVPTARKRYIGRVTLDNLRLYESRMAPRQTSVYVDALKNPRDAVYNDARQASLAIDPAGNYGRNLNRSLFISSIEKKTSQIKDLAPMFAATIDAALAARDTGRKTFIYSSLVTGSGIELLLALFELLDIPQWTSGKRHRDGLRSVSIITGTQSLETTTRILDKFNAPENTDGRNISILIGSRVISEGISLMAVQAVHILTPFWNLSETDQAIGRAVRVGSHNLLPPDSRVVDIYLHVNEPAAGNSVDGLLPRGFRSIEKYIYATAELKDKDIKAVEQILAENSIDCNIQKSNNNAILAGYKSGDRGCFYSECAIACAQTPSSRDLYPNVYDTHYVPVEMLVATITALASSQPTTTIDALYEALKTVYPECTPNAFYKALVKVLDTSIVRTRDTVLHSVVLQGEQIRLVKNPLVDDDGGGARFISERSTPDLYPSASREPAVDTDIALQHQFDQTGSVPPDFSRNVLVYDNTTYLLNNKFWIRRREGEWESLAYPSILAATVLAENIRLQPGVPFYGIRTGAGLFLRDTRAALNNGGGQSCNSIQKHRLINDILLPLKSEPPVEVDEEPTPELLKRYAANLPRSQQVLDTYSRQDLIRLIGWSRVTRNVICKRIEELLRDTIVWIHDF